MRLATSDKPLSKHPDGSRKAPARRGARKFGRALNKAKDVLRAYCVDVGVVGKRHGVLGTVDVGDPGQGRRVTDEHRTPLHYDRLGSIFRADDTVWSLGEIARLT